MSLSVLMHKLLKAKFSSGHTLLVPVQALPIRAYEPQQSCFPGISPNQPGYAPCKIHSRCMALVFWIVMLHSSMVPDISPTRLEDCPRAELTSKPTWIGSLFKGRTHIGTILLVRASVRSLVRASVRPDYALTEFRRRLLSSRRQVRIGNMRN